jgi:hypothetical protein
MSETYDGNTIIFEAVKPCGCKVAGICAPSCDDFWAARLGRL